MIRFLIPVLTVLSLLCAAPARADLRPPTPGECLAAKRACEACSDTSCGVACEFRMSHFCVAVLGEPSPCRGPDPLREHSVRAACANELARAFLACSYDWRAPAPLAEREACREGGRVICACGERERK